MINHKEMAANIRKDIKDAGIKALVRMQTSCGNKVVVVDAIRYNLEFTEVEQATIRKIGISNNLTWVRGLEIIVDQQTNPYSFNFYI